MTNTVAQLRGSSPTLLLALGKNIAVGYVDGSRIPEIIEFLGSSARVRVGGNVADLLGTCRRMMNSMDLR